MKMKKKLGIATMLCMATVGSVVATERWSMFERRLGMFVHWGIYSVGEWHEQEQWRNHMRRADLSRPATFKSPIRGHESGWRAWHRKSGMTKKSHVPSHLCAEI